MSRPLCVGGAAARFLASIPASIPASILVASIVVTSLTGCSLETHALGADDAAVAPGLDGGGHGEMDSGTRDGGGSIRRDGGSRDAAELDGATSPDGGFDAATPDAGPPDGGCADEDGDGVCNAMDACPGSDDALDEDGDGVPDGCDPCAVDGPAATPIPSSVSSGGITIDGVSLAGGGNVAVVDPGATVSVRLGYAIRDCDCTGCIDQIEVGLVPAPSFSYCAYSAVPRCTGAVGTNSGSIRAPTTPGLYWVRFGKGQNFDCTHSTWWQGTPAPERTIGAICVR